MTPAAEVNAFYDRHPYPSMGRAGMYAYLRMKRKLLQDLSIPLDYLTGRSFLEVACGSGESTFAFAMLRRTRRVVGVDLSAVAIAKAEELRAELKLDHVELYRRDIHDLGDLGGPFDVVMCEILHQLPDPRRGLRDLIAQVRPGGLLLIVVSNRWGNLGDILRYRLVRLLAGSDSERRVRLARRLFYNKLLMRTLVRGLRKKDVLHLDNVITDIYGHPYRRTYSVGTVLRWVAEGGLELHATHPDLGLGGGTRWSRARAQARMLRANQFVFELAAHRPGPPEPELS